MNKIFKHLRVEEETHKRVKLLAALRGRGINEAINFLIDSYNSKGTNNATNDYRKR